MFYSCLSIHRRGGAFLHSLGHWGVYTSMYFGWGVSIPTFTGECVGKRFVDMGCVDKGCVGKRYVDMGCVDKGCVGKRYVDMGCVDMGCVGKGCVDMGCVHMGCVDKGCVDKGCVDMGCMDMGCVHMGCVDKGCVDMGCMDMGCVHIECVDKGCVDKGCGLGMGDNGALGMMKGVCMGGECGWGRYTLTGIQPEAASEAGGTYPIGMHPCLFIFMHSLFIYKAAHLEFSFAHGFKPLNSSIKHFCKIHQVSKHVVQSFFICFFFNAVHIF